MNTNQSENPDDIDINLVTKVAGMPGEYMFGFKMDTNAPEGPPTLTSGQYQVEILLARPNHLPERSIFSGFETEREGNSYIRLAKPKSIRKQRDLHTLTFHIGVVHIRVDPNESGYASKLTIAPLCAKDYASAEEGAVGLVAPLLAGWSVHLDTPIAMDQVLVRDLHAKRIFVRGSSDQWEVWPGPAGQMPTLNYEYTHFASIYQEAISTSSALYRFLCLFKLMEGLSRRRTTLNQQARDRGLQLNNERTYKETYPATKDDVEQFLRGAYEAKHITEFGSIFVNQVWRPEIAGKSFTQILNNVFEPVRDKIAHSFMREGDFGVGSHNVKQNVFLREWLPTLRAMARIRLRNEFPEQFVYQAR